MILEALRETWDEAVEDAPFPGLDDDLLNNAAFESLVVTDLTTGLEERLNIQIPDAVLVPEYVGTLRRIIETVSDLAARQA